MDKNVFHSSLLMMINKVLIALTVVKRQKKLSAFVFMSKNMSSSLDTLAFPVN